MDDLQTYIKLKYFPVEPTEQYFCKLPSRCIDDCHIRFFGECTGSYHTKMENLCEWYAFSKELNRSRRLDLFERALESSLIKHYGKI